MPRTDRPHRVLVAMSGGVDSSVAAALLKQQGHEVVGCFMRLGSHDGIEPADDLNCDPTAGKRNRQGCCSVGDAADGRLVAAMLGIPFYVINFRSDFGRIINYFVDEYNAGRTPNPCVRCNQWLKFGKLLDYARSIEADTIATGHYARLRRGTGGEIELRRGLSQAKDQSYVLFGIDRGVLDRMILPVGEYEKPRVREIAAEMGLPVSDKPDSQEICFVPDNDYVGLLDRERPGSLQPGTITDTDGRPLGQHEGHQHFTIGQRRGLSLSLGYPVYVVDKDPQTNTITVGPREHIHSGGLIADEANWLLPEPPTRPRRCLVQCRAHGGAAPARVQALQPDGLRVEFDQPQAAVSPGQAVVIYDGQRVLGGGWIRQALPVDGTGPGCDTG